MKLIISSSMKKKKKRICKDRLKKNQIYYSILDLIKNTGFQLTRRLEFSFVTHLNKSRYRGWKARFVRVMSRYQQQNNYRMAKEFFN